MTNSNNPENLVFENAIRMSPLETETFILSLLEYKLKQSRKRLLKIGRTELILKNGKKLFFQFDAVAPDGIDTLTGPTIIEIKRTLTKDTIQFISNTLNLYPEYKSVLLIFSSSLANDERDLIRQSIISFPADFKLTIWDKSDILNLSEKYSNKSIKIAQNIGREIFKTTVEQANSTKDWRKDRDIIINGLQNSFRNDEIVLFLGAGVSKDAGLPSWDELLRMLNISMIESNVHFKLTADQKDEIISILTNLQLGAPLATASYIKQAFGNNFLTEIRKALYIGMKPFKEQILLSTIAKASRPLIGKLGIKAIITYNFDDLLEKHLEQQGTAYKSIYREGDFEIASKRPIYHVHGFIPRKPNEYSSLEKSTLVFSEDGYLSLQNDPYSWSNLVQLKSLRESTCILIGLSGIDPNLRRLFSNFSKRYDGCKHYIVMQRQLSFINTTLPEDQFMHISNLHHKIQENVFRELGLNVIWYESHDEIPGIIKSITES